jgi:ubiquinone/menaquinone biosynthesis C-methylase UbiE
MSNKTVWGNNAVVNSYQRIYLDKPEKTIFDELKPNLMKLRMLDIGVGCGRTTQYFANQTKEYTGIDYSEAMISFCELKYKNLKNTDFYVCDARDMTRFSDCSFEFVLFSFNGIDYVNQKDRLKVLREMNRVCCSTGLICFSSHNLQCLDNLFSFRFSFHPIKLLFKIRTYILLRLKNPQWKKLKSQNECELIDPGCNFRLSTVYISPTKQIDQLMDLGFKNIRVFSLNDGLEIFDQNTLSKNKDSWLYYLFDSVKD